MAVQLTGLGGFDSSSVITQLVDLASKPLTDIDKKKALVDSATSTLTSFSNKLTALKTAATALSTSSGFSSMAATSSDTGIVASVTGSASGSTFSVEVSQIAKAQKTRSNAQASATTALGQAGDISIKVGSGDAVNISILPTDSLSDIANKISQSGGRFSAGIVNAGGSYRLTVQGLDTGAENSITFGESGVLQLGLSDAANTYENAQDAKLTVDGLAVTRPTNSIADAIPGVTLALTKPTTAAATIGISADSSSLKTKLNALVSAYNDIVNTGHSISGYGTTKAANSVLAADPAVRRSLDRVASLVTGLVPGATGNYKSLSTVGLSLSRDGLMSFDSAKLDTALSKDPTAVRRLFVTDAALGATGLMKTLADTAANLITGDSGPVRNRLDALAKQSTTLTDTRAKKEERVKAYEQQLRKQFSNLDIAMSRYNSMSSAISGLGSG